MHLPAAHKSILSPSGSEGKGSQQINISVPIKKVKHAGREALIEKKTDIQIQRCLNGLILTARPLLGSHSIRVSRL